MSIAKSCPDIEHGGGVEVGLLADLPRSMPSGCARNGTGFWWRRHDQYDNR